MSDALMHDKLAHAIRFLAIDAVEQAKSGHPGMPMGMADVALVLFRDFLKFDPENPDWHDRDRFILSAGHGSMLLYALLYLTGYPECTADMLKNFRQLGSKTAGHPEYGHLSGIETTTGPLGQGLANAVGMALAERMLNARFGDDIVNHHSYVIAGDGCLMEGISQEAISLAGHLQLSRLIVLFDDNGITIDGKTSLSTSEDQEARFRAAGFDSCTIDGHNPDAIHKAIAQAQKSDKPSLICCKTHIGFGSPNKQDSAKAHGAPLGADEIALVREKLAWDLPPFEIAEDILQAWRAIGKKNQSQCRESQQRLAALSGEKQQLWQAMFSPDFKSHNFIQKLQEKWQGEVPKMASRKASEVALEQLMAQQPALLGGSADLTGSNNTKTSHHQPISPNNFDGNYIYYGIREHGMAAMMNGLALHGGFIPYGGTFLVFSDYMRPAIRLSALMQQKIIYVLTHDSIGLGEDGPTHQPIEHLASLRAIPSLLVLRPADALEVAQCWQIALDYQGPSALILSRQDLTPLPNPDFSRNVCEQGGYCVLDHTNYDITLLASGSEVSLALEAADALEQDNITARVVSLPIMELFDALPEQQRQEILGNKPRLGIEAAIAQGWERYGIDAMIAMQSFGASAPGKAAFEHFGFTIANITQTAKKILR